MTVHDPGPAFIVGQYHSAYGVHKATWCTTEWFSGIGTHGMGGYEAWDTTPIDADDMVQAWVTLLADTQPSTVVWDSYTIYTRASIGSPALPRASGVLGIPGTSTLGGWFAAVMHTFNCLDTAFNRAKVCIIEASSGGDFGKVLPAVFTAEQQAIIDAFTGDGNAFASRAGFQPMRCDNITKDLNDRLRREYHLT